MIPPWPRESPYKEAAERLHLAIATAATQDVLKDFLESLYAAASVRRTHQRGGIA